MLSGVGLGLAAIGAAIWSATGYVWQADPPPSIDDIEWVAVRRADLETEILAGGDLLPTRQTTVRCQVEDITESDGTVVLSVIANGAQVKKGDELCRLDSSELEEMARQEAIAVEEARAGFLQAELELDTARIAFREYREGLVLQTTKELETRIALSRSDAERQADRLAWTRTMVDKGYLSRGQLASERHSLARARHELAKAEGELQVFQRYQAVKEIKSLQSRIGIAETNHRLASDRLKAEEEELAYLQKQVDHCTLRAPHDGVVVYAHGSRWRPLPLDPGTPVYQNQEMFILPDLSQVEVELPIHETVGARVRLGMKAQVRIASLPDQVFPGRVVEIALVPLPYWKQWDDKVKAFTARVRLDKAPGGVLPFMSASVKIDTGRIRDALVIPVEAMAVVDGEQSCYVIADGGLERRAITTRYATTDLLQVTDGVREGERVVVRPGDVREFPLEKTHEPANDLAAEQTISHDTPETSVPAL
jgi:HlyD family secretion protein